MLIVIFGWLSTVIFSVLLFPQIFKTLQVKKVDEISLWQYILAILGNLTALVYSMLINQPPLYYKYIFAIIMTIIYISIYIYYRKQNERI